MTLRAVFALLLALIAAAPARADSASFGDWAAVVIAGDWRAADGRATNAFENSRRDVTAALVRAGFRAGNIRQFSPDPFVPGVLEDNDATLQKAFAETAAKATGGCLFYVSSHGAPGGAIIFGHKGVLRPADLDLLLDLTCPMRPTIVILSACYSGAFVKPLADANRMILTAARPDRSSFGCGVDNRYPHFDTCLLSAMPSAPDFAALAANTRACVAAREKRERLSPPSEPQLSIGDDLRTLLPRLSLRPK